MWQIGCTDAISDIELNMAKYDEVPVYDNYRLLHDIFISTLVSSQDLHIKLRALARGLIWIER